MSLQTDLDAFKSAWLERVGPDVARLVDDANAALSDIAARARRVGDPFVRAVLPDHRGRDVDLGALADESPLVVVFYRGGWCPYCNLQLRAFQSQLAAFTDLGARLVAISPEAPDNSLSTAARNDLAFPVLSDMKGEVAGMLGIRFEVSAPIRDLYGRFGHDLARHNADETWTLPIPATYVVARGGRIVAATIDPDYRRRMDPAQALAALRSITG